MKRKRLYLKLTDLAFERLINQNFKQEEGRCIVCNNKLHGNQMKFCSRLCYQMYGNTLRSKHHHYETNKYRNGFHWNYKEILLAFKEINLSDYDWKL